MKLKLTVITHKEEIKELKGDSLKDIDDSISGDEEIQWSDYAYQIIKKCSNNKKQIKDVISKEDLTFLISKLNQKIDKHKGIDPAIYAKMTKKKIKDILKG